MGPDLRWLSCVVALVGCGAAPTATSIRAPSVRIGWAPTVGAVYHIALALTADGEHLVAEETFEVVAVDGERISVRASGRRMDTRAPAPVRLPPRWSRVDGDTELVLDRGGAVLSIGELPAPEGNDVFGVPLLALFVPTGQAEEAREGDTWAFPVTAEGLVPFAGTSTLVRADESEAVVGWTAPASDRARLVGETTVSRADGLPRRLTMAWPRGQGRVEIEACLWREDEPPCALVADEAAPRATSYVETCSASIDAIDARLGALDGAWISLDPGGAPSVPDGTPAVALDDAAPTATMAAGLSLEGRAVTAATVSTTLDRLRDAWPVRHGVPFPERVRILAPPATPLRDLAPVLTVGATMSIEIVVALGTAPPPSAPAWWGDLETGAAREWALEELWPAATAGCPEARSTRRAWESRPTLAIEEARAVLEAVRACGCGGVDLDAVEALLDARLRRSDARLGLLVSPPGGLDDAALPADATLGDLVTALLARPAAP